MNEEEQEKLEWWCELMDDELRGINPTYISSGEVDETSGEIDTDTPEKQQEPREHA